MDVDVHSYKNSMLPIQPRVSGKAKQATIVRDDRIDSVKYWLVVLVIAVHVLMKKEFDGSTILAVLWNWMNIHYSFSFQATFPERKTRKNSGQAFGNY